MAADCVHPLPLYRPRDPQASDLWRLMDGHFETFHADQAGVRIRPALLPEVPG